MNSCNLLYKKTALAWKLFSVLAAIIIKVKSIFFVSNDFHEDISMFRGYKIDVRKKLHSSRSIQPGISSSSSASMTHKNTIEVYITKKDFSAANQGMEKVLSGWYSINDQWSGKWMNME